MNLDLKYSHPGEYLKEKRLDMNLSLRGLSSKSGVSHTEISKVENGEREKPSSTTIFKMCKALELDFIDIAPLFNIDPAIEEELIEISSYSELELKPNTKLNTDRIRQSEIYALNQVCKEISEKYSININSDNFKEGYKLSNKSDVDFLCLTDNDMVIGIEVKVISNRLLPHHLQGIKGTFADFYFSFYNSYKPDNMLFFVCFISESDEAYEAISDIYKDDFYKFMPILNTRLYKMSIALNEDQK